MDVAVKGTNPALPVNTEKAKALAAALAQIEKQFGKGTIMKLGEGEVIEDIQVVSTASTVRSPMRITEPLPNCFSIWPRAAASARFLFSSIAVVLKGSYPGLESG